ncbi:hypothetical protein D3Y57_00655 (plasmid) [Sphingomonas paeninsulae]|uniref:Uncharacterized protein n=1 Tax=Sphingomonas paeninsulae TaxID=2319844 RepID=A0A494T5K0_SPHPE|nr:hypothetical protein [Sphingomonas paeninsulae]AYJ84647.1 hypothetical protein D3Y57_00655 [Sphingomonas paeninsulae]
MIKARSAVIFLLSLAAASGALGADRPIATIDLAGPFATRTPSRLIITQSELPGESATGDPEPGVIMPCLRHSRSPACDTALTARLDPDTPKNNFDAPHYLRTAHVAYRQAGDRQPLLIVVLASIHAGNGGQLVGTQALAYRRDTDHFVRLFAHSTGTNNNQEVRFIEAGPLRGAFVTVEPTTDAPFGYWVTVARSGGATAPYRNVLRYRSTTRYNDGNALPVIDSEMPQILHRLSLWRPGQKLTTPLSGCPKPTLRNGALWCA